LYARGLTTGDIAAHFAEIYERVVEEMQAWTSRPLERVYAAVVVDAINVKVRDGQVANRPVYAAIGVDLEGQKDILGMWFGDGGGESAKFWMVVLTELRNRGIADVFFLVCDGLKGLPDSVNAVWPSTIVQTCLIHLIRNSKSNLTGRSASYDERSAGRSGALLVSASGPKAARCRRSRNVASKST
jgi:putative transposase